MCYRGEHFVINDSNFRAGRELLCRKLPITDGESLSLARYILKIITNAQPDVLGEIDLFIHVIFSTSTARLCSRDFWGMRGAG